MKRKTKRRLMITVVLVIFGITMITPLALTFNSYNQQNTTTDQNTEPDINFTPQPEAVAPSNSMEGIVSDSGAITESSLSGTTSDSSIGDETSSNANQ